jgi:hypothetical protein
VALSSVVGDKEGEGGGLVVVCNFFFCKQVLATATMGRAKLLGLGSVQQNSTSGLHYSRISEYGPARQQLFPFLPMLKAPYAPWTSLSQSSNQFTIRLREEPLTISMKSEFKVFVSFGILQVEIWKRARV